MCAKYIYKLNFPGFWEEVKVYKYFTLCVRYEKTTTVVYWLQLFLLLLRFFKNNFMKTRQFLVTGDKWRHYKTTSNDVSTMFFYPNVVILLKHFLSWLRHILWALWNDKYWTMIYFLVCESKSIWSSERWRIVNKFISML